VQPGTCVEFPPFRLDLANQELWRGAERLPLRPKPFAVLAYLATHAARLVLRDELVAAVWPDTHVGEGLLRGYVRDLRTTLGDDAAAPRFIETVARRGYRFVAPVRPYEAAQAAAPAAALGVAEPVGSIAAQAAAVLGRGAELAELERRLAEAVAGRRQVVFVTGEAGIGKTTLVDSFLHAIRGRGIWTARGQCVEHFGAAEAYLPLLEALGRLGRLPQCERIATVLARHAPTWLVELPALAAQIDVDRVRERLQGTTRERMLREFAEGVEVLTAEQPLVLVVEDLQWSDPSTLDVVASLAQRRGVARLLVLGTYRPADVPGGAHPLAAITRELRLHGRCGELALRPLDVAEVGAYLARRFPRQPLAPDLARAVHEATEGNPLFVATLVDYWAAHAVLVERDGRWSLDARRADPRTAVPDTLRQTIEQQLDRLSVAARRVLEAASVVGHDFSTAVVAAALDEPVEQVDERCEELAARGLFLRARGLDRMASGTVAGRYEFLHALYRQVLYGGLPATRRVRLHRRVGACQESSYGVRAREHAAELALHFEAGHDPARAVHHLEAAAQNALRRHAYREATALLARALDRLAELPADGDHVRRELSLRMALGTTSLMTRGYASPEVEDAYARALELSRHADEGPELAFALAGLFRFFFVRAEFPLARELAGQVLRIAERHPALLPVAHSLVALPLLSAADFAAARHHLEASVASYDFERHRTLSSEHGDDPGLTALAFLAIALWFAGCPDRALARIHEAQTLARRLGTPYCLAFAESFAAWIHVRRGDAAAALACSDGLMTVAAEQGFAFLLAEGAIFRGWALAEQGRVDAGIEQIQQGLAAHRAAGAEMGRPSHLALLAGAYGRSKRPEDGLGAVEEGLAIALRTGERAYEADLHRLRGELIGQMAARAGRTSRLEGEAEECFRHALDVARRQGARAFELRAALALVRLHRGGRGEPAARRHLRQAYASFTEGFETADLVAARTLLDAVGLPSG